MAGRRRGQLRRGLWPVQPAAGTSALGHAHNVYLNFAAEAGLLGLLAYGWLWLAALWQALRCAVQRDRLAAAVGAGVLGGLAAASVHNFFDNLWVQHIYLTLALLLGLLTTYCPVKPSQVTDSIRLSQHHHDPSIPGVLLSSAIASSPARRSPESTPGATRFLKFAIVGAIGMLVDLAVLTFCREAGLPRWPSGFTVASSATSPGTG